MCPISALKVLKYEIPQGKIMQVESIWSIPIHTAFIISIVTTNFNMRNRFLCMLFAFLDTVYSAKEHLINGIAAKDWTSETLD